MQLKAILNRVQPIKGFVYESCEMTGPRKKPVLHVTVRADRRTRPICSSCQHAGPGYDTLEQRRFEFVPLWGICVFLLYAMRRVDCENCGVTVESVPWAEGKSPLTTAYAWFLATWAKRMSWLEVARAFPDVVGERLPIGREGRGVGLGPARPHRHHGSGA